MLPALVFLLVSIVDFGAGFARSSLFNSPSNFALSTFAMSGL